MKSASFSLAHDPCDSETQESGHPIGSIRDYLPLLQSHLTPRQVARPSLHRSLLVVDDVRAIAERITQDLTSYPGGVLIAEDGLGALKLYQERKPELIVLDKEMPGEVRFAQFTTAFPECCSHGVVALDNDLWVELNGEQRSLPEAISTHGEFQKKLVNDRHGHLIPYQPVGLLRDLASDPEFQKACGILHLNFTGEQVCLLIKSLTGFRTSPQVWFFTFSPANGNGAFAAVTKRLLDFGADRVFSKCEYKTTLLPALKEWVEK